MAEGVRFSTCHRISSRKIKNCSRTKEYRRTLRGRRVAENHGIFLQNHRNSIAKEEKGSLVSRHRHRLEARMDFTHKPGRRGLPGGTYSYLIPLWGIYCSCRALFTYVFKNASLLWNFWRLIRRFIIVYMLFYVFYLYERCFSECIAYKRANVNVVSFSTEIAFHSFRINNFKQDRFLHYLFLVIYNGLFLWKLSK